MKRRRRKRLSRMTVAGVLCVMIVLCGTLWYKQSAIQVQKKAYAAQVKELKQEQKELQQEKKELQEFEDYVKTDEYVEEIAREKFGLVYDGEIVFQPESSE